MFNAELSGSVSRLATWPLLIDLEPDESLGSEHVDKRLRLTAKPVDPRARTQGDRPRARSGRQIDDLGLTTSEGVRPHRLHGRIGVSGDFSESQPTVAVFNSKIGLRGCTPIDHRPSSANPSSHD